MLKWVERQQKHILYPIIAFALVFTISMVAYTNYTSKTVTAYRVILNGEYIGTTEDKEAVETLLQKAKESMQKAKEGFEIQMVAGGTDVESLNGEGSLEGEKILTFEPVRGYKLEITPFERIKESIDQKVEFQVKVVAIKVDGEEVLYVRDMDAAQKTMDHVIKYYVPTSGNRVLLSHSIPEEITYVERYISPNETIFDPEDAASVLLRGTDEIRSHKVARGESLWTIASRNSMTVSELRAANPQLKSDVLQIGQELNLIVPKPYLNVETKEEIVYNQSIPFTNQYQRDSNMWYWESRIIRRGTAGSKEVRAIVTRVNGDEVDRKILEETIIKEPIAQIVSQGTRRAPDRGTGRFMWPVTGNITSPYGPRRGGFHNGVDIAAPTGTPIYAADSGTVAFAGRQGNYGLLIIIDHGNGFQTYYAHNSVNLVRAGQSVEKGDLIGRVGSTGNSSGPHVHFEIRINGNTVNPMNYFR